MSSLIYRVLADLITWSRGEAAAKNTRTSPSRVPQSPLSANRLVLRNKIHLSTFIATTAVRLPFEPCAPFPSCKSLARPSFVRAARLVCVCSPAAASNHLPRPPIPPRHPRPPVLLSCVFPWNVTGLLPHRPRCHRSKAAHQPWQYSPAEAQQTQTLCPLWQGRAYLRRRSSSANTKRRTGDTIGTHPAQTGVNSSSFEAVSRATPPLS
jgi:hypothetical protein